MCIRDRYNTENKIAVILGPSNIVSDNNHIYSERGFYNTCLLYTSKVSAELTVKLEKADYQEKVDKELKSLRQKADVYKRQQ